MTARSDCHVHTNFSDGRNTPDEVAAEALRRHMTTLGFSDHGYAPCDLECCIPFDRRREYVSAVWALKERYRDRLEILCGLEQDYYSLPPVEGVEYIIGSVHYLRNGDDYRPVDNLPEDIIYMAENWFGGDYLSLAEDYFARVSEIYDVTGCDIIGHFDLISKLNGKGRFFDESDPGYVRAWQKAADKLLKTGKPFEINTGAISRGYRDVPSPAPPIQRYLADHGARFILSGDSHRAEHLCFDFDRVEAESRAAGLHLISRPF